MKVPFNVVVQTLMSTNNCFSIGHDGIEYKIVNAKLEPLEAALKAAKQKDINVEPISKPEPNEFPKYQPPSKVLAIIVDERLPHNLLERDWCSVCCPRKLMPPEMKARWDELYRSYGQ